MIKRRTPKRVTTPDGRTFLARYKRIDWNALPANVTGHRTCKVRTAQGSWARVRRRAKPAHQIRGRRFSFPKKAFNFANKAAKNLIVKDLGNWLLKNYQNFTAKVWLR